MLTFDPSGVTATPGKKALRPATSSTTTAGVQLAPPVAEVVNITRLRPLRKSAQATKTFPSGPMSTDGKLSLRKLAPGSGEGIEATGLATAWMLKLRPPSVDLTNICASVLAPLIWVPLSKNT